MGPHTTFRRGQDNKGPVEHYESYKPQLNSRNPNSWESEKRFDRSGAGHYNKATGERVPTPHIQERSTPGGVRAARPEAIPK